MRFVYMPLAVALASVLADSAPAQEPLGEEVQSLPRGHLHVARDANIPRSGDDRGRDRLQYAWYAIEDSTMQVAWWEPSGIKINPQKRLFDGDIDLLALSEIRGIEVRAMLFNIWREPLRTLRMTRIVLMEAGKKRDFDPGWFDAYRDMSSYATSLMWIHRVMLGDGTILEADEESVLRAARIIGENVSAEDLLPDREREGAGEGVIEE